MLLTTTSVGAESNTVKSGQFSGLSDHVTTGDVSVVRTGAGLVVNMADNFSLDGAPDPKVGFGRGGGYDETAQLAPLAAIAGSQSYDIPASIDIEGYDEIYIWCEQFSVPLGVAKLR